MMTARARVLRAAGVPGGAVRVHLPDLRQFGVDTHGRLGEAGLLRRFGDDRDWFVVTRPGSGSGGHDFWQRIRADENRRALIEYLKTL